MTKKLIFVGILAVLLMIVLIVVWNISPTKFIPLLDRVYFGMTPRQAEKQLGVAIEIRDDVAATGKTAYLYSTMVLGHEATVMCYFINNNHLTEVQIQWNDHSADLHKQVYVCLYDHYSNNKDFFVKEVQYPGERYSRTSIGIDSGATGLFYSIFRDDERVVVSCVDNS